MKASSSKVVRIVLVGDAKVGKTSLITTLISEKFQEQVAPVIPEVSMPPSTTTDSKYSTLIVDTSSKKTDKLQIEQEIKRADVICVVYDISRLETFERIDSYWLPEIRRLSDSGKPKKPVILVGNKIDVRGTIVTNSTLEGQILPIMDSFKEVETCIECSAKAMLNVHEVFYFAQKAVFYPTEVLYDSSSKRMKDDCVRALKRIFRLCDKNRDGVLDDNEINQFQQHCFSASLKPEELQGVKDVVRSGMPHGVTEEGLNVKGFLYLHHLFIQKGRLETTWTVLRKFGYADNLQLRDSFLCPVERTELKSHTCELSEMGYNFFTELFHRCDKDNDGVLNDAELEDVFSTCIPPAWPSEWGKSFPLGIVQTNESGHVSLAGWLSVWSMTTLLRPHTTLRYLAFLGFEGNTIQAITTQKKGVKTRTLRCYVFGPAASGKTTFLNCLLGKQATEEDDHIPTVARKFVVHQVPTKTDPTPKYLVMHEFGQEEGRVLDSTKKMMACDVACILFDCSDPDFVEYVTHVRDKILKRNPSLPCIYFATKTDVGDVLDETFARKVARLKIPEPKPICLLQTGPIFADICKEIIYEAQHPNSKYLVCGKRTEYSKVLLFGGLVAAGALVTVPLVIIFFLGYSRSK